MLHVILNKKMVVGLFSDYQKCRVMFEGIISNKFADRKNLEIKSYYANSITEGEYKEELEETISNNILEVFTDNNTTDTENISNKKKPEIQNNVEENKKRAEIQNNIYELKRQKEKLEESKRVYDVDLDLYNKFKKIKETNLNFTIPDMFIDKYELMEGLEKENKLCWENFHELYKPKNMNTNYDKLFN
jgi:hypothetical protein